MHWHCFIPKRTLIKQNPEKGQKEPKQEVEKSKKKNSSSEQSSTEWQSADHGEKSVDDNPTDERRSECLTKGKNETGNFSSLTRTPSFLVNFRHTLEVSTQPSPHTMVNGHFKREKNAYLCHIACHLNPAARSFLDIFFVFFFFFLLNHDFWQQHHKTLSVIKPSLSACSSSSKGSGPGQEIGGGGDIYDGVHGGELHAWGGQLLVNQMSTSC